MVAAVAAAGKVEEPQADAEMTPPRGRAGINIAADEPPAGSPDSAGRMGPQLPSVVACMPPAHCQIVSSLPMAVGHRKHKLWSIAAAAAAAAAAAVAAQAAGAAAALAVAALPGPGVAAVFVGPMRSGFPVLPGNFGVATMMHPDVAAARTAAPALAPAPAAALELGGESTPRHVHDSAKNAAEQ